tara:strand:- start:1194 stop:1754 length:561 start_codon:yes stop_codon:yes gene_type:complete
MATQDIYIDFRELADINKSFEKIRHALGPRRGERKIKQIVSRAVSPLRTEMRNLAPVHKNHPDFRGEKRGPKGKRYYYYRSGSQTKKSRLDYKSGTLKRSVGKWMGKSGVFVAPRIGKLHRKVLGNPKLDGWYAHLAIAPHNVRGGKRTSKHLSPNFVEKARLRKRGEVLKNISDGARKVISNNYR